ncbi:MAG: hypothetical protein BWY82_00050 [Verrucomicrobia bacterium ADurb.Bin474]|nr:MAG: hypothetical protein BWY82_00050 [Verrucomicrobia bacterium ADurb.Bin474]
MHQRTTLDPGKHAGINLLGIFLTAQDQSTPRSAQGLVSGRGHKIRVRNRRRMHPGSHQTGDVGDVRHQQGTGLLGNLAHAGEIDRAGIRRCTHRDHLRLLLHCQAFDFIVIDVAFGIGAVVHHLIQHARKILCKPVSQVPAVLQTHCQDLVARLDHGKVNRHIRLRPRVRLHIRMLRTKERLCTIPRKVLGDIHRIASAIVAFAGIPFRVLVCHHATSGFDHRRQGEVFGSNQLDVILLALLFCLNRGMDLRINLRQGTFIKGYTHGVD